MRKSREKPKKLEWVKLKEIRFMSIVSGKKPTVIGVIVNLFLNEEREVTE